LTNEAFHIKEDSWIAALAAKKLHSKRVAITIGKTIHLHNCSSEDFLKDERWVKHEKCHIEQFKRYGFVFFIILYVWETIKNGYHNNRFEAEAREAENIR